jgi:prepilin-type N-terminal cleavage/methylation domain-containing protein
MMINRRKNAGFTLIELMIVVAIIAIIASVAIPRLMAARLSANESAAISTLRSISSAQAQIQSSGAIDTDNDGGGEYAFLGEMAGTTQMRVSNGAAPFAAAAGTAVDILNPSVLSAAFGNLDATGFVTRSGYNFQVFLPDAAANPVGLAEAPGPAATQLGTGPNNCEVLWCAYAWPANVNQTGNRAFFTNQEGDLMQTQNRGTGGAPQYDGIATRPAFSAAYTLADMGSPMANGIAGTDGNVWVPVN